MSLCCKYISFITLVRLLDLLTLLKVDVYSNINSLTASCGMDEKKKKERKSFFPPFGQMISAKMISQLETLILSFSNSK